MGSDEGRKKGGVKWGSFSIPGILPEGPGCITP